MLKLTIDENRLHFKFITKFCHGKNRDFILNVSDYIFLTSISYNTKDTHP